MVRTAEVHQHNRCSCRNKGRDDTRRKIIERQTIRKQLLVVLTMMFEFCVDVGVVDIVMFCFLVGCVPLSTRAKMARQLKRRRSQAMLSVVTATVVRAGT